MKTERPEELTIDRLYKSIIEMLKGAHENWDKFCGYAKMNKQSPDECLAGMIMHEVGEHLRAYDEGS